MTRSLFVAKKKNNNNNNTCVSCIVRLFTNQTSYCHAYRIPVHLPAVFRFRFSCELFTIIVQFNYDLISLFDIFGWKIIFDLFFFFLLQILFKSQLKLENISEIPVTLHFLRLTISRC